MIKTGQAETIRAGDRADRENMALRHGLAVLWRAPGGIASTFASHSTSIRGTLVIFPKLSTKATSRTSMMMAKEAA